jgi:hypothetical protein
LLVGDRIAEDAQSFEFDLADVAVLHPDRIGLAREPDSRRGACVNDVAWLKRYALGDPA